MPVDIRTIIQGGLPTGPQGQTGTSGFSGFSGLSGFSGVSGFSGFSGVSGFSGISGFSGRSGFSGISGFSGAAGSGGSPGGSTTQIQYNNASAFGGVPSLTYDGNNILIKDYGLVISALGSITGTATVDLNNGNFVTATVTGGVTWTFSNPPAAAAAGFILELTNGGSATQIWPVTVKWPSGTAPTLTTSGVDVLTFVTDDNGTNWRGVASMLDSK